MIKVLINFTAWAGLFLAARLVWGAPAAAPTSRAQEPNPLLLLQQAALARQQIVTGEIEFQVYDYWFKRPQNGTNLTRLKARFQGHQTRFEQFNRTYRYALSGMDATAVIDAKMRQLKWNIDAAVDGGLMDVFDERTVTIYDGAVLLIYRPGSGTEIVHPSQGGVFAFDPRTLGLTTVVQPQTTVEMCLAYREAQSITLVGKETVEGVSAWRVHVKSKWGDTGDFWFDVNLPHHVVKHGYALPNATTMNAVVVSKYNPATPRDPLPTEVVVLRHQDGAPLLHRRLVRTQTRYNVNLDSASWSMAGLDMPVGTEIIDPHRDQRVGYWNGTAVVEHPITAPQATSPPRTPPNASKLLRLVEQDPKSPFAAAAASWLIVNAPDGPVVEQAAKVILREHLLHTNLVYLCAGLERLHHGCASNLLRAVFDKNPNAAVKAQACFSLAAFLKSQGEQKGNERMLREAEQLFQRVVTEYGQVRVPGRSLVQRAHMELSEMRTVALGKMAPEIEGEDLEGRPMKLSDFRGKVVVLTFWGAWSDPSIALLPEERKLVERMAGKSFAMMGVNADKDWAKVKTVLDKEKITWPSFQDRGAPGPIAEAWQVREWPTTYVLDRKGIIRYRNVRGQALHNAVETLLRLP